MKKQSWNNRTYYVCPKYGETKGACSLKSWREDRLIDELKNNIIIEIGKANIENRRIEKIRNSSDYKLKHMTLLSHIDRLNKWLEYYNRFGEVVYDDYLDTDKLYRADFKRLMDYKNEKIEELEVEIRTQEAEIEKLSEVVYSTELLDVDYCGNKSVDEFSKEDYAHIIKTVIVFDEKIEIEYY